MTNNYARLMSDTVAPDTFVRLYLATHHPQLAKQFQMELADTSPENR